MREAFAYILEHYLDAKRYKYGSNDMNRYVLRNARNVVRESIGTNSKSYKVEGSPGRGRWADVPWICIYDLQITDRASEGFYICYLFRADMTGVYLSLNQGWTHYNKKYHGDMAAVPYARATAEACREVLNSIPNDFSFHDIDLGDNKYPAKGYEAANICSKFYHKDSMPDDLMLISDLHKILGIYRELKGNLDEPKSMEASVSSLKSSQRTAEEAADQKFQDRVCFSEPNVTEEVPYPRPNSVLRGDRISWLRDPRVARGAIERADFLCEYDTLHLTFTAKSTDQNYVEAHHLIPMKLQGKFEHSLDVTNNIVSLCPTCHSRFHRATAESKAEIVSHFYHKRFLALKHNGIYLPLEELLNAYGL